MYCHFFHNWNYSKQHYHYCCNYNYFYCKHLFHTCQITKCCITLYHFCTSMLSNYTCTRAWEYHNQYHSRPWSMHMKWLNAVLHKFTTAQCKWSASCFHYVFSITPNHVHHGALHDDDYDVTSTTCKALQQTQFSCLALHEDTFWGLNNLIICIIFTLCYVIRLYCY